MSIASAYGGFVSVSGHTLLSVKRSTTRRYHSACTPSKRRPNVDSVPSRDVRSVVLAKKNPWKLRNSRKRNNGKNWAEIGIVAVAWATAVSFIATLSAPLVFLTGALLLTSALATIGAIIAIFAPIIPIIAIGAAFGLPAILAKFSFLLFFDKLISIIIVGNFIISVLTSYRICFQNSRKREKLPWDTKSTLSVIPAVNGLAWAVALNDVQRESEFAFARQAVYFKNLILYSLPTIPLLLGYLFSTSRISFLGWIFLPGYSSLWVSFAIGAIHLQLEKRRVFLAETSSNAADEMLDWSEVEEQNQQKNEFEEFDARLRRTAGSSNSTSPSDWSVGDVISWFQDNGFSRYVPSVVEHDVDGIVFLSLTDDEIRSELRVKSLGDRKRLRDAIELLKSVEWR